MSSDESKDPISGPIAVTGGSGYIASWIIQYLLEQGYSIRATVRDPSDSSKTAHLTSLPGAAERLELFPADLLTEGAFDSVFAGCAVVMHTASPYVLSVADPETELVQPALQGTLNALRAAKKSTTVKRVVLTSSIAAIADEPDSDHVLTEEDWNSKSSLTRNPYWYSKTVAERAAWDFVKTEKPGFDLVVINPCVVIGPSHTSAVNTSVHILTDMFSGTYPGILSLSWSFVDVRDVARAHILAMQNPKASGRYLCGSEVLIMKEVVEYLESIGFDKSRLPTRHFDSHFANFAVKTASYFKSTAIGTYLRSHIGKKYKISNAKIRKELGLEFRPSRESILDTIVDLEKWGHIDPRAPKTS